ncbi:Ger(x)C family spore germination protein [Paenibacillus sp. CF384]|uniref:Ger(x)C family spore germination protein n=1 Tax=Paenibacillus sp. CF384 TaxID=1884382 RepID=UPI000898E4C4|nr:Ger(x)C family spore germination protein [Paenibacillus sp. CF384]SDW13912.1 germination protein, Ger(x)C family [Paenibacillus sp. CF384]
MRIIKRLLLGFIPLSLLAGCSPDVREINSIALVTITGVDYDEESKKMIITLYCNHTPSASKDVPNRTLEWIASASGDSILDAARNIRSRAGKQLIWQHDKFFIVGESAARHKLYEIIDYFNRSREIRMSGYLAISKGKASDILHLQSESGDLITNEIEGKVRNEHLWGKSINIELKDIVNYYTDSYRGFVLGKLFISKPINSDREVMILSGGAVINKGKLVGWMNANDVLSVHLLMGKKKWRNMEFVQSVPFHSDKVSLMMKIVKSNIYYKSVSGMPALTIDVKLKGTLIDTSGPIQFTANDALEQLEDASEAAMQKQLTASLSHFQHDMKVDVLGFSDFLRQYHPYVWKRTKPNWTEVYPTLPVTITVSASIPNLGMSQVLGGP